MKRQSNRGKEHLHTFACYDDTWKWFTKFKKDHNMSAEPALQELLSSYYAKDRPRQIKIIDDLIEDLQNLKKRS